MKERQVTMKSLTVAFGDGGEGPDAILASVVEEQWTFTFLFPLHVEAKGTRVLHYCPPQSHPRVVVLRQPLWWRRRTARCGRNRSDWSSLDVFTRKDWVCYEAVLL